MTTTGTDTTSTAPPPIGTAIRILREATGLSQRKFAERAGFDNAFLSRVERGLFRPRAAWLETFMETADECLTHNDDNPQEKK